MIRVRSVFRSMFDEIHRGLLHPFNPAISRDRWQRVFSYGWRHDDDPAGWVLEDDGRIVGFVGVIFSTMSVSGRSERFCNVHSWIVQDSHRRQALALIRPILDLDDLTITNVTNTETVHRIFLRFGFEHLETHTRILFPVPLSRRAPSCATTADPNALRDRLDDIDRERLDDHLPYARFLLASDESGYCFLVLTRGRRRLVPTARVHHISNPERFVRCARSIQRSLWRHHRVALVEFDNRLVPECPVRPSYLRPLTVPRLFRSPTLRAEQITNLYTELVLLNF